MMPKITLRMRIAPYSVNPSSGKQSLVTFRSEFSSQLFKRMWTLHMRLERKFMLIAKVQDSCLTDERTVTLLLKRSKFKPSQHTTFPEKLV